MKTRTIILASLLLTGSEALAQEIQLTGPLAGAPAVRELRLYRQGRVSIAPMGSFSINDEYQRHLMGGLRIEYNVFDFLALGLFGAYTGYAVSTSLTDEVQDKGVWDRLNFPYVTRPEGGGCSAPGCGADLTRDQYKNQLGLIQYYGGVQASLIPFRGKFSLFSRAFVDSDLYLFLGVAAVGIRERGNADIDDNGGQDQNPVTDPGTDVELVTRTAVAPTFGFGISSYLNNWVSLFIEYRLMPFSWNTSGTDEAGSDRHGGEFPNGVIDENDALLHFNQFFNVGVGFHLPSVPKISE